MIAKKSRRGFTVIELTAVSLILVLISAAIFAVLARGLDVWKRGSRENTIEKEAVFVLARMSKEVRSSFKYPNMSFDGTTHMLALASYVDTAPPDSDPNYEIGRVVYQYDPERKALYKTERPYSKLFLNEKSPSQPPPAKLVLSDVESCEFRYLRHDPEAGKPGWLETPYGGVFPIGVRAEITIRKEGYEKKITKSIYFPATG